MFKKALLVEAVHVISIIGASLDQLQGSDVGRGSKPDLIFDRLVSKYLCASCSSIVLFCSTEIGCARLGIDHDYLLGS